MNWIRVAVKMKSDPRIGALAAACRVRIHEAVGLVCCTLMEFPDHARDGDVAAVPDVVLEEWARWVGEPGVFAQAFRERLCDDTGVVRSWEKYNGKALRKAEADIERKRAARERRQNGAETARAESAPSARRFSGRRQNGAVDETRRDETILQNNNNPMAPEAPPAKKAKYPHFPTALSDIGYQTWLEKLGATDYAVFRKAFAPIFNIPEAERPPALPRDAEFTRIVELYAVAIRGTRAQQFAKPGACAERATQLATAAREPDPERRLYMARSACGTVEEQRRLEGMAA